MQEKTPLFGSTSFSLGDLNVLIIKNYALQRVSQNTTAYQHNHPYFELHCILDGEVHMRMDREYRLTPHDLFLIPPQIEHGNSPGVHKRFILNFSLHKNGEPTGRFSEYDYYSRLLGRLTHPILFRNAEIDSCVATLCRMAVNDATQHIQKVLISMIFIRMTEYISSCSIGQDMPYLDVPEEDADRRAFIEQYIDINFNIPHSIDDLCTCLRLSRRQLDRVVFRLFGESYHTLITRRRMENAEILLKHSEESLAKIADKIGYTAYSAFYTAACAHFGMPPDAYRKMYAEHPD